MIYSVFVGNWITILEVSLIEEMLKNRTPMRMIKLFHVILITPNFEDLFSNFEWSPLTIKLIFELSGLFPHLFMEYIFVVCIGGS